ncbi:oxidoreductase [Georgenia alba]|uniref:Oxidoreductase n=1 Tax=Georgenia alba TaxID=2233858 RepID=A0ABW2QAA6_9MICO
MGLFTRWGHRRRARATSPRAEDRAARERTLTHFREFVATRKGVEAYVEPATANDPVTVVLVATTGEWTRRRVPDAPSGFALARELGVPAYDVLRTGYPPRMRRWSSQNRHR